MTVSQAMVLWGLLPLCEAAGIPSIWCNSADAGCAVDDRNIGHMCNAWLCNHGLLVMPFADCRFEVPFNIWCSTCGEHIAKGVRFNAEKKQVRGTHTGTQRRALKQLAGLNSSCTCLGRMCTNLAAAWGTVQLPLDHSASCHHLLTP
jgi:hypothetical protein